MKIGERIHIGDGVYVTWDGYHLVLTANVPTTDTVYLDPKTRKELRELLQKMKEEGYV